MLAVIVMVVCSGAVTLVLQRRTITALRDQLDYQRQRDRVGDLGMVRDLRLAHKRIAGLLASPTTYLRARRIIGPLDLPDDEVIAELEIMEAA